MPLSRVMTSAQEREGYLDHAHSQNGTANYFKKKYNELKIASFFKNFKLVILDIPWWRPVFL